MLNVPQREARTWEVASSILVGGNFLLIFFCLLSPKQAFNAYIAYFMHLEKNSIVQLNLRRMSGNRIIYGLS